MKSLLILAAAAAITPVLAACGNSNPEQEAVKQDEKVMEQLGDKGSAAVAEPGTEGVTENGDSVVTIVDEVNIK